jgi:hypothetical protein
LTKSQLQTELNKKGQQLSRPNVFFIFSSSHFLKTIMASRTSGTFGFAPTQKGNASAKPKEPLFANALTIHFKIEL